jgi:serine/threonine protein kinase
VTPSKSGRIRFNEKKYYCLVKEVGSSEIAILNYLKLHSSEFVCKLYHIRPATSKCDTCLYFEPLVSLKHATFKTYGGFLNLSLNYILNGLHALQFLESCQIYHRDISPNNLMFEARNECFKLIDFGHAVFEAEHKDSDIYGTEGFVDPIRPWDKNDLFSFGKCISYDIFNRMLMMDPDTPRSTEMLSIISKLSINIQRKDQIADLIVQGFAAFSRFKVLYGVARSVHWIE